MRRVADGAAVARPAPESKGSDGTRCGEGVDEARETTPEGGRGDGDGEDDARRGKSDGRAVVGGGRGTEGRRGDPNREGGRGRREGWDDGDDAATRATRATASCRCASPPLRSGARNLARGGPLRPRAATLARSYAILAYRSMEPIVRGNDEESTEECMTFVMSDGGSTKMVRRRHWGKFVRLARSQPRTERQHQFERSPVSVFSQGMEGDRHTAPIWDIEFVPNALDEECSVISKVSERAR